MKELAKKLKRLLKKNDVLDILLFGSFVKESMKPNDIDVAVITNDKNKIRPLKDEIKKITKEKAHVNFISLEEYDKYIWLTLIKEGFSVKHNKFLYDVYGIKPVKMYKYSLKHMTNSQKVMFDRAIKGFDFTKRLSNRVVIVPIAFTGEFEDFLKRWNIDIETEEYELLPVVRR